MNYEVFLSDSINLADKVDTNIILQLIDTIFSLFKIAN